MPIREWVIAIIILSAVLVGRFASAQDPAYSRGSTASDITIKCGELAGDIKEAYDLCEDAKDLGSSAAPTSDQASSVSKCYGAMSCTGLFVHNPNFQPETPDQVQARLAKAQALAQSGAGTLNDDVEDDDSENTTLKTLINACAKSPDDPSCDPAAKAKFAGCNALGMRQQFDTLAKSEKLLEKRVLEDQVKVKEASKEIDESQAKLDGDERALKDAIQNAFLDQKSAQTEIEKKTRDATNSGVDQINALSKALKLDQNQIISYTKGADYQAVENQYTQELRTALAACQIKLKAATGRGSMNVKDLNTLINFSGSTSSNPFANSGAITTNFCAADNDYIKAKRTAYNNYLENSKALRLKQANVEADEKDIFNKEQTILAETASTKLALSGELTTKLAHDQLASDNAQKALDSEQARAKALSAGLSGPLQGTLSLQSSDEQQLADIDGKLSQLKKAHPTWTENDSDKAAEDNTGIQEILRKGSRSAGDYAALSCPKGPAAASGNPAPTDQSGNPPTPCSVFDNFQGCTKSPGSTN